MPVTVNPFLLKALALGLAASQVLLNNDVKTSFDAQTDQAQVMAIMQQGCQKIMQSLSAEVPALKNLKPDVFLENMIKNAELLGQSKDILPGLHMADAKAAYDLFCHGTASESLLKELLVFYNTTLHDLPDVASLKDYKLPEFGSIDDANGRHFTDIYRASRRRLLRLDEIPKQLQNAVLAAEDKHFYEHHGVDEHGLIRAAASTLLGGAGKRAQGGSTITQQLIKNLLVGDKITYERKLKEMVLANQLEKILGKKQIFEMYINFVYMGRSSWGAKMAAVSWFDKPLEHLSLAQTAFLAGMPKGPKFYSPDNSPERSLARTRYVLEQMRADEFISEADYRAAWTEAGNLRFATFTPPVAATGAYFSDELVVALREQLGLDPRTQAMRVRSTIHPEVQGGVEAVLQEGLAKFELTNGRARFDKPEGNIAGLVVQKYSGAWQRALTSIRPPLPDVHWPLAVMLPPDAKAGARVGLTDGRILNLRPWGGNGRALLKAYDLVYVQLDGKDGASLRHHPEVQGAALVMESKTGRVVAMMGGFSHQLNVQNRTVHMVRSPGSTVKPLTYLGALTNGLQPNTLILDGAITLSYKGTVWAPNSGTDPAYDRLVTLRDGLENSRNRVTARLVELFAGGVGNGLAKVRELMRDCGVHKTPPDHMATIIGTIDIPMINIATCFATIVNGGLRPQMRLFDSVEKNAQVFTPKLDPPSIMQSADAAALFQLRTLLQGVVVRGTAKQLSTTLADVLPPSPRRGDLSDYIGGKTGTSQDSIDAWFVGFTSDLTIVTWVGYDNATKKTRRSLGGESATGANIAAPIWAGVLRATLRDYPLKRLPPPSAEASEKLFPAWTSTRDGHYLEASTTPSPGAVIDFLRLDANHRPMNTWEKFYRIRDYAPTAADSEGDDQ